MQGMRCYHHYNCEDRPAVATCSECGKALCRECADNLRSPKTGKILCVDCRNAELGREVAWANGVKARARNEIITIIIGLIIGIALQIFFGVMKDSAGSKDMQDLFFALFLLSFVFFLPTLFASLGTIKGIVDDFGSIIFKILSFVILCVLSPIIFIVRIKRRVKRMKLFKAHAKYLQVAQSANREYADLAAKMKTRLTTEEFEREMRAKYENLARSDRAEDRAEFGRKLAEERRRYEKEIADLNSQLTQKSKEAENANENLVRLRDEASKIDERRRRAEKQAKSGRRTDEAA